MYLFARVCHKTPGPEGRCLAHPNLFRTMYTRGHHWMYRCCILCVCACEQYRSVLGKVTCVYSGCAAVRFIVKRAKPVCERCEKESLTEFLDRRFNNCILDSHSSTPHYTYACTITLCCTSGERTLSPAGSTHRW